MKDYKEKTVKELQYLLTEKKEAISGAVKDVLDGKQKDVKMPAKIKKDIARIKTLLKIKEESN